MFAGFTVLGAFCGRREAVNQIAGTFGPIGLSPGVFGITAVCIFLHFLKLKLNFKINFYYFFQGILSIIRTSFLIVWTYWFGKEKSSGKNTTNNWLLERKKNSLKPNKFDNYYLLYLYFLIFQK